MLGGMNSIRNVPLLQEWYTYYSWGLRQPNRAYLGYLYINDLKIKYNYGEINDIGELDTGFFSRRIGYKILQTMNQLLCRLMNTPYFRKKGKGLYHQNRIKIYINEGRIGQSFASHFVRGCKDVSITLRQFII